MEHGQAPLPHLTPHRCRRTFASVLYALGESPAVVMAEMGHRNPSLVLSVYAQAMRRDPQESERLRVLVDGGQVAVETADEAASIGSYWQTGENDESEARSAESSDAAKSAD